MKNVPTGKKVLLFSGGMDSLAAAWLLRPDVLLFLPHGQRYEAAERTALRLLEQRGCLPPGPQLIVNKSLSLGSFERDDAIIPLRNMLFACIAAQYGETILIGAMDGDRSLDKSPEFFKQASQLLSYLYAPQHWCEPRTVVIESPFVHDTKTTVVRRYLEAGYSADALLTSLSCYEQGADASRYFKACGTCKPCFRKWVALRNNGVEFPYGYFMRDPWTAEWLPDVMSKVRVGMYRGREDAEWMQALSSVGVV